MSKRKKNLWWNKNTKGQWETTKQATCTEDGLKIKKCTVCEETIETEVLTKLGHDYKETIIAPTCTKDGYTKHVCNRCGDTFTDKVTAKLGHNYVEGVCTRCGDTLPDLTITASGFTGTYDGKAHSISVSSPGNIILYSTDNVNFTETNPSFIDAGTFKVYYKVSKENYKTITDSEKI